MDVSTTIFVVADEFASLLAVALGSGASVLFRQGARGAYQRVPPYAVVPPELLKQLRSPRTSPCEDLIYAAVDDESRVPDKVDPERLICLYFGGTDHETLFLSPLSARTGHPGTLKLARKLTREAKNLALGTVVVVGDKTGRTLKTTILYSDGARAAVAAGRSLRQRSVRHSRFEIAETQRTQ